MKLAKCPWCDGDGKKLEPVINEYSFKPGSMIMFESVKCIKCEGSGIIEYAPVKEVKNAT